MTIPEAGPGVCHTIGSLHWRHAPITAEGQPGTVEVSPVPQSKEDLFGAIADSIIAATSDAAAPAASWCVLGVPGTVKTEARPDGSTAQLVQAPGILSADGGAALDPAAEMVRARPAVRQILEDPAFTFLCVRRPVLAVQAAATFYGTRDKPCDTIACISNGTAITGHIARRDKRFPEKNIFHADEGPWEVGHLPISMQYPNGTFNTTYSGKAIAELYGKPAEKITDENSIWDEVGKALGTLALHMALYGGAELVVFGGSVAIYRQQRCYGALEEERTGRFNISQNPMADKIPQIQFVLPDPKNGFETRGAWGVIRSHLVRQAIDEQIRILS